MRRLVTATLATALTVQAALLPYLGGKKHPPSLSREEISRIVPSQNEEIHKAYMKIYDDPDIDIAWKFNIPLPGYFVDKVFERGIEDAGRFFNLFFKIDRYNARKISGNEFKVTIYDVDEILDVKEDSMVAYAKEFKFDTKNSPRTLVYYGRGHVKFVGLELAGDGLGNMRYVGDSLDTKLILDAKIRAEMGDFFVAIGSLFVDDFSDESIAERGLKIQDDLYFAASIINSDTSLAYIDRALESKRISKEFYDWSKGVLESLPQNKTLLNSSKIYK